MKDKINIGDAQRIRQSARRLLLAKRKETEKTLRDMEKEGLIEPSNSLWVSTAVLVKKKDGSTRFCLVYKL